MDIRLEGTQYYCSVTRSHIFEIWCKYMGKKLSSSEVHRKVCDELINELPIPERENINALPIEERVKYVSRKFKTFWELTKSRVQEKHSEWLKSLEQFDLVYRELCSSLTQGLETLATKRSYHHTISYHGLISIVELSEEAAEARNKDLKSNRLRHTRKMTRVVTNTDLLYRLLLTSDPYLSRKRKWPPKKGLFYQKLLWNY